MTTVGLIGTTSQNIQEDAPDTGILHKADVPSHFLCSKTMFAAENIQDSLLLVLGRFCIRPITIAQFSNCITRT